MKKNITSIFNASSHVKPLIIFEMANNHMGDVLHGIHIIQEFAKVAKKFDNFHFAMKFQFRNLDTFIHPEYKQKMDFKYVKRFSETKLSQEQFAQLKKEAETAGFLSICTPFDEESVDTIVKMKFDILKIGSCSFTDWPLLEKVITTPLPVIASTAGAELLDIDHVVSFFQHREKTVAILHCVGEYPTKVEDLQLNQIDFLKKRYPEIAIGFSTHEEPDATLPIQLAIAKGAKIFEKHVGVATEKYPLNAYSSTPEQVESWLIAGTQALKACGLADQKPAHSEKEMTDLRQFKRGVFAKVPLQKGDKIDASNTFLAFPNTKGQILANDLSKYTNFYVSENISVNAPIINPQRIDIRERVNEIVTQVQKLLKKSNIILGNKLDFELSHHYGIDRFKEFGATIVTCVNREYCKKLIIMFPGQVHPVHFHKEKEETFHILYGDFIVDLDGKKKQVKSGDIITVERGVKHGFTTKNGGVFEEISSTHYKNDSFYIDEKITSNLYRKTHLTYWVE